VTRTDARDRILSAALPESPLVYVKKRE